jgi:hypothetical protein
MFKKIPEITINALMVMLLVAMLGLPITALGLTGYNSPAEPTTEVLSAQDCQPVREEPAPQAPPETPTYSEKDIEYFLELFETMESRKAEESEESDEIAPEIEETVPEVTEDGEEDEPETNIQE